MGFCSCLPCFKDKDTRHSTEEDSEKPIPVQKVIEKSNGSAKKPSINDSSPSNAVTFSDQKNGPNDRSKSTQAQSRTNNSTPFVTPGSNSAVSFNNDKLPESYPVTSTEPSASALNNRNTSDKKQEPDFESNNVDSSPAMADSLKSAAGGVTDTVSSGAQQVGSTAQSAASTGAEKVTGTSSGTQDWEAMTEDQKKQAYDALPEGSEQKKMGYYEWVMQGYYQRKENWMPWIEDAYLRWFTKDNKASYATKDAMDKSKITGVEQVDKLQDSVNSTVSGQVGQGGLLQPVGDAVSREGVNRAERGGKDDGGSYLGSAGSTLSSAGGSVFSGAKSAGGYVGGMFSGKKDESAAK